MASGFAFDAQLMGTAFLSTYTMQSAVFVLQAIISVCSVGDFATADLVHDAGMGFAQFPCNAVGRDTFIKPVLDEHSLLVGQVAAGVILFFLAYGTLPPCIRLEYTGVHGDEISRLIDT